MSKIYVVVETYYNDYNIINAWATEEEATAYCDKCYTKTSPNSWTIPSWKNDYNWVIFIDEVVFNGNIINESI